MLIVAGEIHIQKIADTGPSVKSIMSAPALKSINAVRVIGEYMVVRQHTLASGIGMDMFVREMASLFVVLSGFSMMYRYHDSDFSARQHVETFVWRRWWCVYPTYLLFWACNLPDIIIAPGSEGHEQCNYRLFCYFMQPLMMDCWLGCGFIHKTDNVLRLISCIWWFWVTFPMLKNLIISFFSTRIWEKMTLVGLISMLMLFPLERYDVMATGTFPLVRFGEFLIGCGTACALRQQKSINTMMEKWYWCPFVISLGGMIVMYSVLGSDHGWMSICIHRDIRSFACSLWGQVLPLDDTPPCYTSSDIFVNKNAMAWAVVIYCLAQAEVDGNSGAIMSVLGHDFFAIIHRFSLTLYLGHVSVAETINWMALRVLQWDTEKWHADLRLGVIYTACLLLHHAIKKGVSSVFPRDTLRHIPFTDSLPGFDVSLTDDGTHIPGETDAERGLNSTEPQEE
jgi:hypothetical protein